MRILVSGASGLLGLNFCLRFASEHSIDGIVHTHVLTDLPFDLHADDLTEEKNARTLIERYRPDLLVHCAALADLDACEKHPQMAYLLNTELPGWLAEECMRHSVKMIHLSTDAVFDGTKKGKYVETDSPLPPSVYAQTKLGGEQAVQEVNSSAFLARVNFYGFSLSGKRSLAEFFLRNLQAGNPVYGFTDMEFSSLYVLDLSEILMKCAEKDLQGLYHVTSPQSQSKYDFGIAIARKWGFDEGLISPLSVQEADFLTAPRSQNLALDPGKVEKALGLHLPSQQDGLDRLYTDHQDGLAQRIYDLNTQQELKGN